MPQSRNARDVSVQNVLSLSEREIAFAKASPLATAISANPTRSAKVVRPVPFCARRDTAAKARVNPAAATNQRCWENRLIRGSFYASHLRKPRNDRDAPSY